MADGLILAAPRSGSGKTVLTLGLIAALRARGTAVAAAKTGPDYIDPAFLALAAGAPVVNLDPWAMSAERLLGLADRQTAGADLLVVEGVMGLFDGAVDGRGSTADLAAALGLPVLLVVDADRQSQSAAALAWGFSRWRADVAVAGVLFNRVGSSRHEAMLREALAATGIPCLGCIPRDARLAVPERHLGLVLPAEVPGHAALVADAAAIVSGSVDLDGILGLARPLARARPARGLVPLGQHVAIARDLAFAFVYPHLLQDWRADGATLSFFSPLADEAPDPAADAVFLPGGYPELHGGQLASAGRFLAGLHAARERGALVYGECGGFMVLGQTLVDASGAGHAMAGLLPVTTRIDRPRRVLGYRRLSHASPLPWPSHLAGHEFHYSSGEGSGEALFTARDARGEVLAPMGCRLGRVMGSYAHVIDTARFD